MHLQPPCADQMINQVLLSTRKRLKKCLWLRRGHNCFLQTEAPSEEGTEDWYDTEEFPSMDLKRDSGKGEYR